MFSKMNLIYYLLVFAGFRYLIAGGVIFPMKFHHYAGVSLIVSLHFDNYINRYLTFTLNTVM